MSEAQETRALLSVTDALQSTRDEISLLKKELSELAYQLSTLYERWAVEQQHIARREAEMTRTLEHFKEQIQELDKIGVTIEKSLNKTFAEISARVLSSVREDMRAIIRQEVITPSNDLKDTLRQAERLLQTYQRIETTEKIKTWAMTLIVSVLVGLSVGLAVSLISEPFYRALVYTYKQKTR